MSEYLSSLDQASKYQGLILRPFDAPEKKCQHEGQLYLKCGKAFRVHDASWKVKQGIAAFALTLLALLILPLMFKSYCKLVGKLWQQCSTGKENFALYLLQNRTSSSDSATSSSSSSTNDSTSATSNEEETASGKATKSSESDAESPSSISDNSDMPEQQSSASRPAALTSSLDGSGNVIAEKAPQLIESMTRDQKLGRNQQLKLQLRSKRQQKSLTTKDVNNLSVVQPDLSQPATKKQESESIAAEKEPQRLESMTRDQKLGRIPQLELQLLSKLQQESQTTKDVNNLPKAQPGLSQQATKKQEIVPPKPYPFSAEIRHKLEILRAALINDTLKFPKGSLDQWDLRVANATLKRAERIKDELMPAVQK